MNVYAWTEGESSRIDLGGRTLLVGESGAIYGRGEWTLVDSVGNVEVLDFGAVVELLLNRLVTGVGGKTGEVEGSTRGGCVRHVGGSGANTAGAKASEEGSTVVLLRYGHRKGIGRERGRLGGLFKRCKRRKELHEGSRARGRTTWTGKRRVRRQRERERSRGATDVG